MSGGSLPFIGTPGLPGSVPILPSLPSFSDLSNLWDLSGNAPAAAGGQGILNNSNTNGAAELAQNTSGIGTWISQLFLRTVIIVLGLIFVAIGLSMFKGSGQQVIQLVTPRPRKSSKQLLDEAVKAEKAGR